MELIIKFQNMETINLANINKKGITGMEAAAIMGHSPYRNYAAIEKIKRDDYQSIVSPKPYWGKILSDSIAKEFSKITGLKVRRKNGIYRSDLRQFMIIHMDRIIVGQKAGLKCKTTHSGNAKFFKDDTVPMHYYVAAQHYMSITGYDTWYFAVLCGGNNLIIRKVSRCDEYINKLIVKEEAFWGKVEKS